jgi:signal transduction histidine kinase/CheY-like chemotaxis protein
VNGLDEQAEGDPVESRARARAAVANPDVRALMAVPIRVGDQRLGVLEVMSYRAGAFTREDGATLTHLAEQCAIALRNARLIEELQRSNRLKDDFLANLSHEVRTPLTGIVGWAEVLLDSHGGDPPVKRALEAILGQSETLSRMLADLIDLSRIDNFGLELRRERVRLSETIAGALDAVAPGAAKRGVAIRCHIEPDLPAMEGDPARLKQVVWNLLANGVKFSPTGGTVDVTVARTGDGGIELAVEDEGHGIDPDFLPHVFERFRQQDGTPRRMQGGLGLGLAIVKELVELHGGTVHAESPGEGRGATFAVALPLAALHPDADGGAPAVPDGSKPAAVATLSDREALRGVRLLVVEDDPDSREMMVTVFSRCGATVSVAASAGEAMEFVRRAVADALVCDVGLPGEDGHEFIRSVRAFEAVEGGRIPALALTAYAGPADGGKALAAGFDGHLSKPVLPAELVAHVASLVHRLS